MNNIIVQNITYSPDNDSGKKLSCVIITNGLKYTIKNGDLIGTPQPTTSICNDMQNNSISSNNPPFNRKITHDDEDEDEDEDDDDEYDEEDDDEDDEDDDAPNNTKKLQSQQKPPEPVPISKTSIPVYKSMNDLVQGLKDGKFDIIAL